MYVEAFYDVYGRQWWRVIDLARGREAIGATVSEALNKLLSREEEAGPSGPRDPGQDPLGREEA